MVLIKCPGVGILFAINFNCYPALPSPGENIDRCIILNHLQLAFLNFEWTQNIDFAYFSLTCWISRSLTAGSSLQNFVSLIISEQIILNFYERMNLTTSWSVLNVVQFQNNSDFLVRGRSVCTSSLPKSTVIEKNWCIVLSCIVLHCVAFHSIYPTSRSTSDSNLWWVVRLCSTNTIFSFLYSVILMAKSVHVLFRLALVL